MIKVGIIGANGYTGFELMRLLAMHNEASVVYASSRSHAGKAVKTLYPTLFGFYGDMKYSEQNVDEAAKLCDVVFTCLPHGLSAEFGGALSKKGVRVIDLSADFRYNNLEVFEKIYGITHPCKELNETAVYGLCELFRDKIKGATLVANPGCYTSASILALYPLLQKGLISEKGVIIDAKSGASGAGRKADEQLTVCESGNSFKAYAVATHRHTSEIEEKLSLCGKQVALNFTPHLLPISRGILATIYADCTASSEEIAAAYDEFYANEPFVNANPHGVMPEIKWVAMSNMCQIGYKVDERTNKIIIVSVIDNLIKGASGQAIQNMNIMFGLDETEGLPLCGMHL